MVSVNFVDEIRLRGMIRNFSLPQRSYNNFLYIPHEVIHNLGQPQEPMVQLSFILKLT